MNKIEKQYMQEQVIAARNNNELSYAQGLSYLESTAGFDKKESAVLQYTLENREKVHDFMMMLRGYIKHPSSAQWVVPKNGLKPMLDEEGISILVGLISSVVSPEIKLSNYQQKQVTDRMRHHAKRISEALAICSHKYNLDNNRMPMVFNHMVSLMDASYQRSKMAKEQTDVYGNQKTIMSGRRDNSLFEEGRR